MKIFRRSPPNREIEFTWHRERGGAGEKGGPSLATVFKYYYCSPYRSRSFPTRNTFPRHLPSIGSSVLVYLSRKRTRSGICPSSARLQRGKRYSRRDSIRSSRNKSTPFFFVLETRVNRTNRCGILHSKRVNRFPITRRTRDFSRGDTKFEEFDSGSRVAAPLIFQSSDPWISRLVGCLTISRSTVLAVVTAIPPSSCHEFSRAKRRRDVSEGDSSGADYPFFQSLLFLNER